MPTVGYDEEIPSLRDTLQLYTWTFSVLFYLFKNDVKKVNSKKNYVDTTHFCRNTIDCWYGDILYIRILL